MAVCRPNCLKKKLAVLAIQQQDQECGHEREQHGERVGHRMSLLGCALVGQVGAVPRIVLGVARADESLDPPDSLAIDQNLDFVAETLRFVDRGIEQV
jgi:hypothetical protein